MLTRGIGNGVMETLGRLAPEGDDELPPLLLGAGTACSGDHGFPSVRQYHVGVMRAVMSLAVLLTLAGTAGADDRDPWLGRDKAFHLGASALLATGGYAGGALLFEGREKRVMSGLVLALGAGAAKEIHDRSGGGDASWRDVTWNAVGAATGVTISWLIDRAWRGRRQRSIAAPPSPADSVQRPEPVGVVSAPLLGAAVPRSRERTRQDERGRPCQGDGCWRIVVP